MEEMTIWEQHTVTLNKDNKFGFGFAISGGRDKPNPGTGDTAVIVSDLVPGGPAMGRLQTRDQIVMVNGVSVENTTSQYTIQHLKSCGKTANITVKRPRTIQIPASGRPTRASSQSNLLDNDRYDRKPPRGSDSGYGRRPRSTTPERNGHDLPLMSGYKRLPNLDASDKPIKATLVKLKPTDEYGMKLGSQIFIKHMTPTGLAAKEGTLQEGDLVLKINGMTTENLSLLETKHLVEKSRGKLSMVVLRDNRKFLVSIPEVSDSPQNSTEERSSGSSSELEEISDLDMDIPVQNRSSRAPTRERRTRRTRNAEAPTFSKSRDSPDLRTSKSQPPSYAVPRRRVSSESESDHSKSPPPAKHNSSNSRDRYRVLSGISALPNPRASPVNYNAPHSSYSLPRPRKAISESDSDHNASPPPRRESPRTNSQSRYKVLPELPQAGLKSSSRSRSLDLLSHGSSPYRPPPPDESESDESSGAAFRSGTLSSQDSRNRYRATPEIALAPMVAAPKWSKPSTPTKRALSESESDASYPVVPSPDATHKHEVVAQTQVTSVKSRPEYHYRASSPPRPPSDLSPSERTPSPPRRSGSTDHDSNHSLPEADTTLRSDLSRSSHTKWNAKPVEEPLYSLPPDADPTPNQGYSSDQNMVGFVKEGSVGLRLVGGNDVGIFVGGIQPNSPAHREGMREGDQILQVNGVDFSHFTREEAAMFLMNIRSGERINMLTQNKMDIYKKILSSSLGDSFYIRTHFDYESEESRGLSFTRGEVFRVVDTMHRGKLGTWMAVRMGTNLYELDKGIIPNQTRAESLAIVEQTQRIQMAERQASAPRAEFWKLRGLRGAKKPVRRTRDDLLQLTIQGKFPAYEKVVLREANFKRPIVITGPLNDIANEKLAREMPNEFEVAEMVPRGGGEAQSVIKLDTVKRIAEQNKHPLLDITPTAVERLSYIQYHPIVLFLEPHSRKDVKAMRQRYDPNSKKSSRKLYTQALKLKKQYSHLFAAHIDLQPNSNVWYEILKEKIQQQQSKPVWVSEVTLEGGANEELDVLNHNDASDYLSGASDYEDTDGEPYTDGEAYTDNEDLEEPANSQPDIAWRRRTALARSSEPAAWQTPSPEPQPHSEEEEAEPEYTLPPQEVPLMRYTPEPQASQKENAALSATRSFTDSDYSAEPDPPGTPTSEGPPEFRAPDPTELPRKSPPPVTLSFIEQKLQQTRMEDAPKTPLVVLAHHEAMLMRRTQIRGSDSSEDSDGDNDDEENDDMEWGPATEL
ncbi:tight junction protein ZO-3 [Ictalurus furcatus]|uniref:tight junction protein ZO-3 n=1 Tax=Ictalurus furcatus TaxID=66913 RepID=UPI0023509F7C|nr:tight junction protein ZO-3 [Ictalurus furcatus]XP_053490756.1 tight junction protein ZO-3 [Ictalurus furcatus]